MPALSMIIRKNILQRHSSTSPFELTQYFVYADLMQQVRFSFVNKVTGHTASHSHLTVQSVKCQPIFDVSSHERHSTFSMTFLNV